MYQKINQPSLLSETLNFQNIILIKIVKRYYISITLVVIISIGRYERVVDLLVANNEKY